MTPFLLQRAIPGLASPGIVAIAIVDSVVVATIATWVARRTRSASGFFVAGAGVGLWTLAITKMAARLSGFAFIGAPGHVYTLGDAERNVGVQPALLENLEKNMIPLGRLGTPEEAADGVYLFCIPESNYISGQMITVGGGIRF